MDFIAALSISNREAENAIGDGCGEDSYSHVEHVIFKKTLGQSMLLLNLAGILLLTSTKAELGP